jgi:uncharacterized protein (TIGR02453 family)
MTSSSDLEPAFIFLSALRVNNRKDWFDPRKSEYEAAREQFARLLDELLAELDGFEELRGLEPRKCIQRIYRDIRFSKDKTPYHTSLSATLPSWKERAGHMPYYIHLEPGGASMVAGGLHAPSPGQLARFRAAAARDAAPLKEAAAAPQFRGLFGELRGESLKTVPREFPRDHPEAELLRRKEIVAIHPLRDADVLASGLSGRIAAACRAMRPVLLILQEMAGPPDIA